MLAPFRPTFLCAVALLAGCLHNPKKPTPDEDDGGLEAVDAVTIVVPDVRLDVTPADRAADLQAPVEPPPDGGVLVDAATESGAPDALAPDLAPDLPSCTPACTEGAKRCGPGGGLQTCASVAG